MHITQAKLPSLYVPEYVRVHIKTFEVHMLLSLLKSTI